MRLATKEEDFLPMLKAAQQEAEAAFGNGNVYIERYVQNPRHIEFQVGPARVCAVTGHCTEPCLLIHLSFWFQKPSWFWRSVCATCWV